MITELSPARQEHLLELANKLVEKLRGVAVRRVDDPRGSPEAVGIPSSCMGTVASFLHAERDLEKLREFVDRLDQLDRLVGQNQKNPRAQHLALQGILRPWLEKHSELTADEWLYVLSWARRLLPKNSKSPEKTNGSDARRAVRASRNDEPQEAPPPREPPAATGRQMADAIRRWQEEQSERS